MSSHMHDVLGVWKLVRAYDSTSGTPIRINWKRSTAKRVMEKCLYTRDRLNHTLDAEH
jgi:hypothetical protein